MSKFLCCCHLLYLCLPLLLLRIQTLIQILGNMWKLIYCCSSNVFLNSYRNGFCISVSCRDIESHQRAKGSVTGQSCYLQISTYRQACVCTHHGFHLDFSKQDRCPGAVVMKTSYKQLVFVDPEHTNTKMVFNFVENSLPLKSITSKQ